nr:hypothetical protein [Accumulibacter sp.]
MLAGQCADITHADAGFGADQADLAGIHATELGNIEGEGRDLSAALDGFDAFEIGAEPVGARDDREFAGMDRTIDFDRAGKDVRIGGVGRVEATGFDADPATLDPVAFERAIAKLRYAGRQRRPTRIDEAGAVDIDAGGIGDHHLGPIAGHFDDATQPAGVGRDDLVDDDAGGALGHPRVAGDPAGQVGADRRTRVVEDRTLSLDIEAAVRVARDTGGAWTLHVHQRYAVAGIEHRRTLVARRVRRRDDLGDRRSQPQLQSSGESAESGQPCDHSGATPRAGLAGVRGHTFRHCHRLHAMAVEDETVAVAVHRRQWIGFDRAMSGTGGESEKCRMHRTHGDAAHDVGIFKPLQRHKFELRPRGLYRSN